MKEGIHSSDAETSPQPLNTRDFDSVLQDFRSKQGTRDYHEMVKDIGIIVRDPRGTFAKELRQAYPGWNLTQFKKLLETLGEQKELPAELGDRERVIQKMDASERREKIAHAQARIASLRKVDLPLAISTAEEMSSVGPMHFETKLKDLQGQADAIRKTVQESWMSKTFPFLKSEKTKKAEEERRVALSEIESSIRHYQAQLNTPIEDRQRAQAKLDKRYQDAVEDIKRKIEDAEQQIADLKFEE